MQGDFTRKLDMARQQLGGLNTAGVYTSETTDPCAGYLICQNFEGTGYDNSETWTETVADILDENYTGTVLRGSQSLRMRGNSLETICKSPSFGAAYASIYAAFRLQVTTRPATAAYELGQFRNAADASSGGRFQVTTGGNFQIIHGSVSANCANLTNGTTYYIWVEYHAGTGLNGIMYGYISSTTTKPGSATCSITTGTDQDSVQYLRFRAGDSIEYIVDQVLVNDSVIGDLPT